MAGQPTISGKIIKEYLERFPNVQTLTLAKKIYRENKEAFASIETVRSSIRFYRGKSGKQLRK